MRCRRCGKDLGGAMRCGFCGYENTEGNVREMTRTEKNFFRGVTIEAGSDNSSDDDGYRERRYETRTTYINFTGGNFFTRLIGSFVRALLNGNTLARVAAALILVALGALMFFVALPILFVILAAGLMFLALAKLSR
ncbi:MAG: hypothetical protein SR2Q5_00285 [Quinella sp. 2Q5]|nr:hypothetical protein [Quinella sp. 2Q5]